MGKYYTVFVEKQVSYVNKHTRNFYDLSKAETYINSVIEKSKKHMLKYLNCKESEVQIRKEKNTICLFVKNNKYFVHITLTENTQAKGV